MHIETYLIVFPEGETQEISGELPFNALVDMNGGLLDLPLRTHRMIAYRVSRITSSEDRGETIKRYFLDLVAAGELASLVG